MDSEVCSILNTLMTSARCMYMDCMAVHPVLLTERETKAIYHCYELWYDGASFLNMLLYNIVLY